jgi:hypothetical protein
MAGWLVEIVGKAADAGGEAILVWMRGEAADGGAVDQLVGDGAADESGGAGDEDGRPHGKRLANKKARRDDSRRASK